MLYTDFMTGASWSPGTESSSGDRHDAGRESEIAARAKKLTFGDRPSVSLYMRFLPRGMRLATSAAALCTLTRISMCEPDASALRRSKVTGSTEVASTRWLSLSTLDYEDATGRKRKWDMATRTTKKPEMNGVDGVAIVALLRQRDKPEAVEMLLVEQFRPPLNAVTVELPAGLIDPGESPETAALRELKEETGYVGSSSYTSGKLAMSPGLCDECVQLCVVEVDLDAPENKQPMQECEETEFIKVTRVPVRQLLQTLKKMEAEGSVPFTGLYTLAVGLQMGQSERFQALAQ